MGNKLAIIAIVLFASALYLLTLRGAPGNPVANDIRRLSNAGQPFELSPERGRFANIVALAERGTYDLGQDLAEAVYPDVGYYEGRFFSYFAPGMSYLAAPFYQMGRQWNLSQVFAFGLVPAFAVLALVMLYVVARQVFRLPLWAALFAVLSFGFATTSWSYAVTLYQHLPTAFLLLLAFYAVFRYRSQSARSWVWAALAWLSYGVAISIDYPNAVLFLPVVAYLLVSSVRVQRGVRAFSVSVRPALLGTAAVLLAVAGLNAYHNQQNFGSWSRLSGELPGYKDVREVSALSGEPVSVDAVRELQEQKDFVGFFSEMHVPRSFYVLMFSPDRGLLVYAPLLLLGFLGLYRLLRKQGRLEAGILAATVAVNLLVYSSWGDPWGGWAYGPRYLIPSMAILSLFAGAWLAEQGRWWSRAVAFVLLLYSSGVSLLGALTTNSLPPKIEAVAMGRPYTFLYNWELLRQGVSGSFLYKSEFAGTLPLDTYFFLLYASVAVLAAVVIFVIPSLRHEH